jgi:hypothetical protein
VNPNISAGPRKARSGRPVSWQRDPVLRVGNQDPVPANRGFRAQAGCQRGRSSIQAGYGYPEATLRPPSGYLVANR